MPPEASDAIRSRSFGAVAELYHRYRPGPPDQAVDWLLPPACRTALDLGAGTGALTRMVVDRVPRVVALEPDDRMRAVLVDHAGGASVVAARAEDIPLRAGTVNAVTAASSWHWVDPERGFPEVARVLAPGGVLGLLWNSPDRRIPWVADLLGDRAGPEGGERRHLRDVDVPEGLPFGAPETSVVRWYATLSHDEVVGLAGTYSRVITLPEADRAVLLDQLTETVRAHPMLAGREAVRLPMVCWCWRAVRH